MNKDLILRRRSLTASLSQNLDDFGKKYASEA
jgi:hypothetical protein